MITIFDEFIGQLCDRSNLFSASQKVRNFVKLQNQRLEKLGLKYHLSITDRGLLQNSHSVRFSSGPFKNDLTYKTCLCDLTIEKEDKQIYHKSTRETMYQMITDSSSAISDKERINCPNCGNVLTMKESLDGCPYCETHFLMSDLFPSVSNYYFLKDYSYEKKELDDVLKKRMIICGILFSVLLFILTQSIFSLFAGAILGVVLGYFSWAIITLYEIFKDAIKAIVLLIGMGNSKKKLTEDMQVYDPCFSFEYFMSEIVAMMKILAFSDYSDYPAFIQENAKHLFENVVDIDFRGALGYRNLSISENMLQLKIDVYMEVLRLKGNHIVQRDETYTLNLERKRGVKTNAAFSYTHVQCPNCGASFDASIQHSCPYCSSEYDLSGFDWVVTRITKK